MAALVGGVNNLQNTPRKTPLLDVADGAQFVPPVESWKPGSDKPKDAQRARAVLAHVLSNCQISDCSLKNPTPIVQDADGAGWVYEGLNVIFGPQKSKKTTFSNVLAAAYLDTEGAADLCGLGSEYIAQESTPDRPPIWRKVVFFDTEQSDADAARTKRNIAQLLGMDPGEPMPGLEIYTLRDFTPADRAASIFGYLAHTQAAGCLPQIVVLDNLQDFVDSILDEIACGQFVQRLNTAANALRIAIIAVQHTPKADENTARGWLGSLALQKSAIVWKVERRADETHSVISLPFCRYAYPEGVKDYRLDYADGAPTLYRANEAPDAPRKQATPEQIHVIESYIRRHPQGVTVKEIRAEILKKDPNVNADRSAGNIWAAYKNSDRGREFVRMDGTGPNNTKVFPAALELI